MISCVSTYFLGHKLDSKDDCLLHNNWSLVCHYCENGGISKCRFCTKVKYSESVVLFDVGRV